MSFLSAVFGDPNERSIQRLASVVEKVNGLEQGVQRLSDEELKACTFAFRERLGAGEALDSILLEAFATVREAARRTLGQRHFDVQIIGGVVLHEGKIAEMKTGEGKTLTATLAVYANALDGKGAHVVTVNDYLARRDAVWMGQIYWALGMSVGCINHEQSFIYDPEYNESNLKFKIQNSKNFPPSPSLPAGEEMLRRESNDQNTKRDEARDILGSFKIENSYLRPVSRSEAYRADITYGTNNEFGFDYLRDNLVQDVGQMVQRKEDEGGFHYAIVDEVDSILIDEARTPLIISAPDQESESLYRTFANIVPILKENEDYNLDEKLRAVSITDEGIRKIEEKLGIKNLYDPSAGGGIRHVHHLEQALRAQTLFRRDKDYMVRDGEVIIVDEFTGRLMPGRRYSEGLHQAIEAKEGVEVQKESRTLASITFQNYFRMYKKLSGMTGTAITNAEEFDKVYKLDVVSVPTHKPMIRQNFPDVVFRTREGKYKAIVGEIKGRHEQGQPILVGTTSIEKNELLSAMLEREGIPHQILNAKHHEQEAEIIAQAGRLGQVTVATNMAGRGVDIVLGGNPADAEEAEKVKELGGLHVIGTERHEARRIDDQLRGRAGRQGDPGSSQFYMSLEDDLMRIFGGDRIKGLMKTLRIPEDQPIESRMISGAIESAQSKIEGHNFDIRKYVLDYDEVLNKQRDVIYKKRREILGANPQSMEIIVRDMLGQFVEELCGAHLVDDRFHWNIKELFETLASFGAMPDDFNGRMIALCDDSSKENNVVREEIRGLILGVLADIYAKKAEKTGAENMTGVARWIFLRTLDSYWMDHLEAMDYMRDSVRLRAYGQRDPLVEYKREGIDMFHGLLSAIRGAAIRAILHVEIKSAPRQTGAEEIILSHPSVSQMGEENREQNFSAEKNNNRDGPKVGRNDPCPCGAKHSDGRPIKYKHCHGKNV